MRYHDESIHTFVTHTVIHCQDGFVCTKSKKRYCILQALLDDDWLTAFLITTYTTTTWHDQRHPTPILPLGSDTKSVRPFFVLVESLEIRHPVNFPFLHYYFCKTTHKTPSLERGRYVVLAYAYMHTPEIYKHTLFPNTWFNIGSDNAMFKRWSHTRGGLQGTFKGWHDQVHAFTWWIVITIIVWLMRMLFLCLTT